MHPLVIALITAGGSMAGATLAQLLAQHLRNRRENAIKFAEAKQRLIDLARVRPEGFHKLPEGEQRIFRARCDEFKAWSVSAGPYLSVQQLTDLLAAAQLLLGVDGDENFPVVAFPGPRLFPKPTAQKLAKRVTWSRGDP